MSTLAKPSPAPSLTAKVLKLLCRLGLGVLCFLGTPFGVMLGLALCVGQSLGEWVNTRAKQGEHARRERPAHSLADKRP